MLAALSISSKIFLNASIGRNRKVSPMMLLNILWRILNMTFLLSGLRRRKGSHRIGMTGLRSLMTISAIFRALGLMIFEQHIYFFEIFMNKSNHMTHHVKIRFLSSFLTIFLSKYQISQLLKMNINDGFSILPKSNSRQKKETKIDDT